MDWDYVALVFVTSTIATLVLDLFYTTIMKELIDETQEY